MLSPFRKNSLKSMYTYVLYALNPLDQNLAYLPLSPLKPLNPSLKPMKADSLHPRTQTGPRLFEPTPWLIS